MRSLQTTVLLCTCLAASCSFETGRHDEDNLSVGSRLSLTKTVAMPELFSHVILQDGEIINPRDLSPYQTSCILETGKLGPATIRPASYSISKINYNDEIYSDLGAVLRYYTEFYLQPESEQSPAIILTCQILDDTMQYHDFSIPEIRRATGNYFEF